MSETPGDFKDEQLSEFGSMDNTSPVENGSPGFDMGEIPPIKPRKSFGNTVVLLVLVAVGGIVVYFFGLRHQPKSPTEEDQAMQKQLDKALARLTGKIDKRKEADGSVFAGDTEMIVRTFSDYPGKYQVVASELQKNPFSHVIVIEPDGNASQDDESAWSQQQAYLTRELNNKFKKLKLESILLSPVNAKCRISGEVYSAGQKVKDTFVVGNIQHEEVVLIANNHEFVLRM